MVQTFYAFGNMLVVCELCEWATIVFEECSDMVDQLDWYLLPIEGQRMLQIIICYAQRPVKLKCFGNTACDRETFKYVSVCN